MDSTHMVAGRTPNDLGAGPASGSPDCGCSWTISLRDQHPKRTAPIVGATLFAYAGGIFLLHNPLIAAVPALLIVSAVSEYLFPVRYTVTHEGVTASWAWNRLEMEWKDVKRIYDMPDGIKFSPLARSGSRFEAMRGILVRYDHPERREELLAVIQRFREVEQPHA